MDFKLPEELIALKRMIRKFGEKEVEPYLFEDEENAFFRRDIYSKLGELGLTGILVPGKYSGAGLDYLSYVTALEEIAYSCGAHSIAVSVSSMVQSMILAFGSSELKAKYLPKLASGRHIGAFALTEPHCGSDAAAILTTAGKKGASYILNGSKMFITHAGEAEVYIVMAKTGSSEGAGSISAFLVDKETEGLSFGAGEKKMGCNISPTGEVILEDVAVPGTNMLGGPGDGFILAMKALDGGRIGVGAVANGISLRALDEALAYMEDRRAFGKALNRFQGLQFMVADMATKIEASRLLTFKSAWRADTGGELTLDAAMAKLMSTDTAMEVTTDAVQLLGGYGYMREYPVEGLMRAAKALQIVEGTNQIQRVVIARALGAGRK